MKTQNHAPKQPMKNEDKVELLIGIFVVLSGIFIINSTTVHCSIYYCIITLAIIFIGVSMIVRTFRKFWVK